MVKTYDNGVSSYYEGTVLKRTEYAKGHKYHGQTRYYSDNKHVRTRFQHGVIWHIEDGKRVRTTFKPDHARHGEIDHFEDGKHLRTTFKPDHARHGEIIHIEDGEQVRATYESFDPRHGKTAYFEDGELVRTMSESFDPRHGKTAGDEHVDGDDEDAARAPCEPATGYVQNRKRSGAPRSKYGKKKRKEQSRKTKGGSGAMEGEQEFDYDELKRSYVPQFLLQPPDVQFEGHKQDLIVDMHPPAILYTDESSCALDAYNMGANPTSPITRAELEGDTGGSTRASTAPGWTFGLFGETPSSISSSPPEGVSACSGTRVEPMAVNLGHKRVVDAMKRRGHVLVPVGPKAKLPKLQRVLQQHRGVFLVEFHWFNKEGERNHHVVAVNCNLRLVFCNTLGALPFTLAAREGKWLTRESSDTHDHIGKRFHIVCETRVWKVLRAK